MQVAGSGAQHGLSLARPDRVAGGSTIAKVRDYHDIAIVGAALHVVAPRAGHIETTDDELELPLPDDVAEFLSGHVERGLADSKARAAQFIVLGADRAQGAVDQILADPATLVEGSAQLARLLYEASKDDDRVSDATFAVMVCTAHDRGDVEHTFVAALKLDLSSQYRTASHQKNGRRRITLERQTDILPSVNERLQKAAFIRRDEGGTEFRMLLVDRQRERDVVSNWFVTAFLGAELTLDARRRTETLWRTVTGVRNSIQDELSAEELVNLDRYIWGATSGTSINLENFEESLPLGDELRDRFVDELAAQLPDREFDLDPDTTSKIHRRRTFEADNGLRVTVSAEYFDMIEVEDDPQRPGGTVVTIRTLSWTEKS